jgi:hypothetical protein
VVVQRGDDDRGGNVRGDRGRGVKIVFGAHIGKLFKTTEDLFVVSRCLADFSLARRR